MISQLITIITGIGCLTYWFSLVSYAGLGTPFAGIWLLAGCFFLVAAMVIKADKKQDFLRHIPKWLLASVAGVVAACGLLFFVLYGCVLSKIDAYPEEKADYVIVLGAQVRGTFITRSLQYRLDAALEYYEENPDCKIVVSGGQGEGEDISEAQAMFGYLVERGVPAEKIILEDRSTSTNENLRFSYELIKEDGGEDVHIVICSNDFHIFRALELAENVGIDAEGLASKSDSILHLNYMVRDSVALLKEWMLGNI